MGGQRPARRASSIRRSPNPSDGYDPYNRMV